MVELRNYYSEYLRFEDDVVSHASRLFVADSVEAVVRTDWPESSILVKFLFAPFEIYDFLRTRRNYPFRRLFRLSSHGKNKIMIFRDWIVRCTLQGSTSGVNGKALFYFSGAPLELVKSVQIHRHSSMYISCAFRKSDNPSEGGHNDLGGEIPIDPNDYDYDIQLFLRLKAERRLHPHFILE